MYNCYLPNKLDEIKLIEDNVFNVVKMQLA